MKCSSKFQTAHAGLLAVGSAVGLIPPAFAQSNATVSVNVSAPLSTIPAQAFGVNTAVWDGALLDAAVPTLLKNAGVTVLRYPGGSTSDVYHWQSHSSTTGTGAYVNPITTFDNFMTVAKNVGAAPVITVNYGSNAAGTDGGDPVEAAAWVRYANITKKYGVKYWEIGNEIYGNKQYGGNWEEDLHADQSPNAYGSNVNVFATQMKAVDPSIKIGVVLTAPGNWPDGINPDWNTNVLTQCGHNIDFVIVHWYPQNPGGESDAGLLAAPSQIATMVSRVRALITHYCGANAPNVQIWTTETNSVSSEPGKQSVSLVNALFLADDWMSWLENGVTNVDWWDLHNGQTSGNASATLFGTTTYGDYGLLSSGQSLEPARNAPFPPYYGLQMLTKLGKAGDRMVTSRSNNSLLAVHAVKQANGNLAVMLVNKDRSKTCSVSIGLTGYVPASTGSGYLYGQNTNGVSTSSVVGVNGNFSVPVAPYSLLTLVLTPKPATPQPAFMLTGSVATPTVMAGGTDAMRLQVKNDGTIPLANGIVDIEIYSAAGMKIAQRYFTGQNLAAGASTAIFWNWSAPTTAVGPYTFKAGVFSANWITSYAWSDNIATVNVIGQDTAQYSFETGAQNWATSGGMISSVAASTNKAFLGTHSLAVNFTGTKDDTQQVTVAAPATPAGKTLTFHVWIPSGSTITAIQPFVQQGATGNWTWTGSYTTIGSLTTNAWNTITVKVPSTAVTPLFQAGVQFFTSGAWNGSCYVDSVGW